MNIRYKSLTIRDATAADSVQLKGQPLILENDDLR